MLLWNPLEHTPCGYRFLFELGEQTIDDSHVDPP
jgi:hypothetical protein